MRTAKVLGGCADAQIRLTFAGRPYSYELANLLDIKVYNECYPLTNLAYYFNISTNIRDQQFF